MASVRSIDSALGITLNTNGRVIRNLIHGADTVMSHILHFYHLAAADFVNVSPAAGILGSPWDDGQGGAAFGAMSDCQLLSLTAVNTLVSTSAGRLTGELVESYVMALNKRKEAHTMSSIFAGRHPIQNAIVPGGVTTIFTQSDINDFRTKLNSIRDFINAYYIPDVVFVATASNVGGEDWTKYWGVGTNPGLLLSYGEYPDNGGPFNLEAANAMLLSRGVVTYPTTYSAFDTNSIAEYVDYSYYSSPSGLHPSAGATTPDVSLVSSTTAQQYSWLKAPRYGGAAAEVGPLARVLASYTNTNPHTMTESGSSVTLGTAVSALTLGATYTVTGLVDATLAAATLLAGSTVGAAELWSPLGRHAARALECKMVADAMYSWLDDLTLNHTAGTTANSREVYTSTVNTGSGYVYVKIPKATVNGEGLAEAPRGALGHWITIQGKKIANYQCVVPSTWNCCPRGNGNVTGPAESALTGVPASTSIDPNSAICNIARMLHPYDFCIACAVHVVNPEGKEIAKFKMDLDGGIKPL
jgi:hydrogenase large subunit